MSDALELIIKHGDTPTKAAIATGIQRQSIYRNAQYKDHIAAIKMARKALRSAK